MLRSDQPFAFATGYFGMPEKTVEAWRNLWFHTGDRVVRDADGWFRFIDRLKDAIRRAARTSRPSRSSRRCSSTPPSRRSRSFPVRSELAEDEVAAAVVLRAGHTAEPVELIRHCEPRLAYFAIPRYVQFVEALPLTENGKVRKAVLRDAGVTDDMWDREAAGVTIRRLGR